MEEKPLILIDGFRYQLMKPQNEAMLEDMIKEHSKEIWGENSVYFDKKRLKAQSGIASIPDGFVVVFEKSPRWFIVEVELLTHQLHNHLTPQISKFSSGISNKENRDQLIEKIYESIENDELLMTKIKDKVAPSEVYKFLTGAIKGAPILVIVIDEKTTELEEVLENFSPNFKEVHSIEFQTFQKEGSASKAHAHVFEPIRLIDSFAGFEKAKVVQHGDSKIPIEEELPNGRLPNPRLITIQLQPAFQRQPLIPIRFEHRPLFPGYKEPFVIETDYGHFETHVVGASNAVKGDSIKGSYLRAGIPEWYRHHPDLRGGNEVQIEVIEPMHRYKLIMI
jgi:hypothetical protein